MAGFDYFPPRYEQFSSHGYSYILRAEYHGGGNWQATVRLLDNSHLSTIKGYSNSANDAIISAIALIRRWDAANGHAA